MRISARIRLPSLSKWTGPVPPPSTNWYASATATQFVQFSLIAIEMFCGVTTEGLPSTRTISKAIATAAQSLQLLYATAALVSSTTSLITWRIANATLNTVVPSFVLIAIAALSPAWANAGRAAENPAARRAVARRTRMRCFTI